MKQMKILIVEDDENILYAFREVLKKDNQICIEAKNGIEALELIDEQNPDLVFMDITMPKCDGLASLRKIQEKKNTMPVIIITGYSTPEMERLAREGGAVGYAAKPFLIENLARQVMTTLRKESEGGTLHNVSSGMFLQLVEMEQKTCTIRLENKQNGRKGVLFFSNGELFDARMNDSHGKPAAYEIFAWDEVNLSIQNGCVLKKNRIRQDVHADTSDSARRGLSARKRASAQPVRPALQPAGCSPVSCA